MTKIQNASKLGTTFYPPEIADFNGLASRYENSNLSDYAQAVYELGIRYFPNYYDFYLQLYELVIPADQVKAKKHLDCAYDLLNSLAIDLPERQELLNEVSLIKERYGW